MEPCKATPPGDSLIELAIGYNKNVSCISLYRAQLKKIKENIEAKESLYNVKPK